MKKCPHCSEEIQNDASKCRFCGEWLSKEPVSQAIPQPQATSADQAKKNKKVLKIIGWVLAIIFGIALWYVTLPILIPILIYKKTKFPQKKKLILSGSVFVILATIGGSFLYSANRTPSISITEPGDNVTLQAQKVTIKGTVKPGGAEVKVGARIIPTTNGEFSYDARLNNESNTFTFVARNGSHNVQTTITVNRVFTDEERAEIERLRAEEETKKQALDEQNKKEAEALAQKKQEEEKQKQEALKRSHTSEAQACSRARVESMLKAPKTAEFPSTSHWKLVPLGDDKYRTYGYVDAENSFGAQIRTNFICEMTVTDPANVLCAGTCTLE